MTSLDFEEIERPHHPILRQPAVDRPKAMCRNPETQDCEVAIIGAGPYGLSLAAQLTERGISFRIFGKPLDTWRHHMPKDMLLKSEGFASNLSHSSKGSTLKAYCAARSIAYSDQALPVSLNLFLEYSQWFRETYVPTLEEQNVTSLEQAAGGFSLTLDDGRCVEARRVVLAVGITWFSDIPEMLRDLDKGVVSHSYDHRDVSHLKGKDVVVLGAGASAIDLAALLHDSGASVKIVARDEAIRYHSPPGPNDGKWWHKLRSPASTIGPGWRSYAAVKLPFLFRFLPEKMRLRIVKRHLGPAPGWFVRDRIEGRVAQALGCRLDAARMMGRRVLLRLIDNRGEATTIECDHIVAATGYKPDLSRIPFMPPALLAQIATTGVAPKLSGRFETSLPGLHVIGPAAANSFGPLMRFMTGAEYVAPALARHLARKTKA